MEAIKIEQTGQTGNRIQPFIMISGDDSRETIFNKFSELKAMGIYSAVLQYSGSKKSDGEGPMASLMRLFRFDEIYFQTLHHMADACRELGMTFWVQDAAPFPTGAADGAFMEPENLGKGKVYLEERHMNLRGPLKSAIVPAENFNGLPRGCVPEMMVDLSPEGPEASMQGTPVGAVLIKYAYTDNGNIQFDGATAVDVTDKIDDRQGILCMDVPEGLWRLFFFYKTYRGGRKYYMNLLDASSVRFQIERVLKLHYEKLKDELGVTWEGFFYDEPEVGNTMYYDFHCLPGYHPDQTPMSLPWCPDLPVFLEGRLGKDWLKLLPSLWYDCGEESRFMRFHYMDIVTRLISENYNGQILPWCRERNIRYIGHILEDENSHARLGCGTGHFFRTEKYQDMSGVDMIAGQVLPGMDMYGICNYSTSDGDGCFYHYGLAKLASSEAHINPDKDGSFCEVNAVYGDVSDARFYKFLLDHLFVNGIDRLVPVITDSMTIPEGKLLFDYANRMCLLMEHSRHVAPVALLYHAEAEWSGDFMYFHKPAKELAAHQMDYDVIPGDALVEKSFYHTRIGEGALYINDHAYRGLVIPYCRYIRKDVFAVILEALSKHVPVYFVDGLPDGYCEEAGELCWRQNAATVPESAGRRAAPANVKGAMTPESADRSDVSPAGVTVVPLERLAATLIKDGIAELYCSTREPYLRYEHWQKDGRDYFLLVNEESERSVETEVIFPTDRPVVRYDVMNQKLYSVPKHMKDGRTIIPVKLGKYESRLYVFDRVAADAPCDPAETLPAEPLNLSWTVILYPNSPKETQLSMDTLCDLRLLEGMARYYGPVIYSAKFTVENRMPVMLDLGNVCDSAEVILNGQPAGLRIAAPNTYDISSTVRRGSNELQIKVQTPAAGRRYGSPPPANVMMSAVTYAVMPPAGLLGPVVYYSGYYSRGG